MRDVLQAWGLGLSGEGCERLGRQPLPCPEAKHEQQGTRSPNSQPILGRLFFLARLQCWNGLFG